MSTTLSFFYQTDAKPQSWATLHALFGLSDQLIASEPLAGRLQLSGESSRYDLIHPESQQPRWSVASRPDGMAILDWDRHHFLTLPRPVVNAGQTEWFEPTGHSEKTPFGYAAEWLWRTERPATGIKHGLNPHISVWLLPEAVGAHDLKAAWSTMLPPLVREGSPWGVVFRIEYRLREDDAEPIRYQLMKRVESEIDPAGLWIPDGFKEGPIGDTADRERQRQKVADAIASLRNATMGELAELLDRVKQGDRPAPGRRVYAQGPHEERAKLLVHQGVVDEISDTLDFLLGLIGEQRSQGLSFAVGNVVGDIRDNAPNAAAPALLTRLLMLHLALLMREFAADELLRNWVNALLIAERAGVDPATVADPANLSAEQLASVHRIRGLIRRLGHTVVNEFSALWADGNPDDYDWIAFIGRLLIDLGPDEHRLADSWLAETFGEEFAIEPTPQLRQRNGRNKGWHHNRYQEDAVADLIDLEVDVNEIVLRFDNTRVFTRATRIPEDDPLFIAMALLDHLLGKEPKDRIGIFSTIRIDELSADLTLATFPTTRSVLVPGLFILCPLCVPLLWQYVINSISLHDLRVLVSATLGNDPLEIGDPTIESRAGPARADDVEMLAFAFDAMLAFPPLWVLQTLLINIVASLLIDGIVNGILEKVQTLIELPEDLLARLQPLLNLNREGHQARLEALAGQAARAISAGNAPTTDQRRAVEQLDRLLNHTPHGVNRAGFRSEGADDSAFSYTLAIRQPGLGGNLEHLQAGAPLAGDFTLLLAHDVYRYFMDWAGYGIGYGGPIYRAEQPNLRLDGSDEVIDFWAHAPDPAQLEERPDYQTHPPRVTPGDEPTEDWVSYSAMAQVSNRVCFLQVDNPAPDEPIAELCVTVAFDVGVITFTPQTYQICEDVTRLGEWLDRTDGFVEPFDPFDPLPPWAEGLQNIRRVSGLQLRQDPQAGLSAETLDSLGQLLDARGRAGALPTTGSGGTADPLAPEGALFSVIGAAGASSGSGGFNGNFGAPGPGFGGMVICRRYTGWDVKDSETWLEARLTMRLPILFGIGERLENRSRFLPLVSYRVDTGRISVEALRATAPAGPLTGLLQPPNRDWLARTMENHARSVLNLGRAEYALADKPPIYPAWGYDLLGVVLVPDGYSPRALFTLHPDHWAPDPEDPSLPVEAQPPYLSVQTFGADPQTPNFAVNFHLISNFLRRVRGQ